MTDHAPDSIDRHQLWTVVRTGLRLDWRGAANPFTAFGRRQGVIPGFAYVMLLNIALSVLYGVLLSRMPGLFEGLVITGIAPFALVALQVLMEFSHIVITPTDYHVIACHPVSSKTFFAAKLVHLLVYVSILAASCALIPSILAAFAFDNPLALPIVMLHYWLVSAFAAVCIIIVFVAALRGAGSRRMEQFAGYAQVIMVLLFYVAMNVVPDQMKNIALLTRIDHIRWIALSPTYWFAIPVQLVTVGFDWTLLGIWLAGMLLFAGLLKFALGFLSPAYALSIHSAQTGLTPTRRRRVPAVLRRLWNRIADHETRALAILVSAQFKHDLQFRLQVIWILPMLLIFMVISFAQNLAVGDPFAPVKEDDQSWAPMLSFFIVMAPAILHTAMIQSKSWRAAWVFFTAPLDRARLVVAAKRLALGLLVFPMAPILVLVFAWLYGNVLHAVMHVTFIVAIAYAGLTLTSIISARLPFSKERAYGSFSGESFLRSIVITVLLIVPMVFFLRYGFFGYWGWVITVGVIFMATLALGSVEKRWITHKARTWEMEA